MKPRPDTTAAKAVSSDARSPFPMPESYSLPELARLWSKEVRTQPNQIAKLLAQAMASDELIYEASNERVLVLRDPQGAIQEIFLPEVQTRTLVAGVRVIRLPVLDPAEVASLLRGLLSELLDDDDSELRPVHRLVRIGRPGFESWLRARGYALPQFWFPTLDGPPARTENQTAPAKPASQRERKKAERGARDDAWRREEARLRGDNSTMSTTEIAKQIAANPRLNPGGVSPARIRRVLYTKSVRANSENRAHSSWAPLNLKQ